VIQKKEFVMEFVKNTTYPNLWGQEGMNQGKQDAKLVIFGLIIMVVF
jgi:hypothetical protein